VTILLVALVVVTITSAMHGAVGFGMNLLAVPVLVVLDPAFVPGPALAMGLVLSGLVAARERVPLDRRLGWAVAGLLPGTAAALLLLSWVPSGSLAAPLGACVLLAVLLSAVGVQLSPHRFTLAAAGVASGFLATAASIGGPPLALVYSHSGGRRLRANLSGFFVVTAVVSMAALALAGHFGAHELRLSLALLPGVLLGYVASGALRPSIDGGNAHTAVLVLSALAGLGAIAEGLWGAGT
jgi:uncharacterized protein